MPTGSASAEAQSPGPVPSVIQHRHLLLQALRGHFLDRDYHEVETPVHLETPALEAHIDAVSAQGGYLRTSPEFHMKRLVAAGCERIFQIGPCFRAGERGALHRPEFTMLEWYRVGADYLDILSETRELLQAVVRAVGGAGLRAGGVVIDVAQDWQQLTVRDAYTAYAGWDPVAAFDADRFDLDMVNCVEPSMCRERPVVLIDYPAPVAALARCKAGDPAVAERWELFVGGIELVNAYSELTDAAEQRRRFAQWSAIRAADGRPAYAPDEAFLRALGRGMPACGGAALGVDRLLMLLANAASLDDVLPFRSEEV